MGLPANHPDVLRLLATGEAVDTTPGRAKAGGATPQPSLPHGTVRVVLTVPVATASEANAGGRRRDAIARKSAVKAAVRAALGLGKPPPLPVVVWLTRVGSGTRPLDDDNLQRALKAVRDVVAEWLGADDADPRIRWRYKQRRDWSPAVVIDVRQA